MKQEEVIERFSINENQNKKIEDFISILKNYNSHTNLVGKSTVDNVWLIHILDSIQILPLISHKGLSILDMGSGAGFPGILLSIMGYQNVTLVDSNNKKTKFLDLVKKELNININIKLGRLESFNNVNFDVITSRALANLPKLLTYSQKFIKKNSVLIFLKGKAVNEEIIEAKKKWNFQFIKKQSISDPRGTVLMIKDLLKKND